MDLQKIQKKIAMDKGIIGEDTALKASVMIPLVKADKTWHILFEVRSKKMNHQPGDICFPGGRIDDTDPTPRHAALRETEEELGIRGEDIDILGELATYVPSSQMLVFPFVAALSQNHQLNLNQSEVDSVFTVPLNWLMNQEPERHIVDYDVRPRPDFPYDRIYGGKKYPFRNRQMAEMFYNYGDKTIWGLTARILQHFLSVIS
ncbi:8-oxo-dGTP pyrophosphatase MutT (NUDIX family) [Scopulibacillus darangshiensis]|uniref:8-oxo-dGTP pyrophosphatase MutT (NUDIX family) n=1 Tax=Scopulibacillus darangshiensis TaxID=442528 RepID=A0A4R2NSV8_9BACL|nr:CoA pyrophosphatase [Scopulibacillus darangshiensis]TCP24564.1 8-oxo-dGTP pyrophosphatase MutT (NUDIX family) [Scopulibacillus darangshiensis]